MGTRADFYIRKEGQMKWLGSKAWDGYPEGIEKSVLQSTEESEYEKCVVDWLKTKRDATLAESGWPWPWDDSRTTDYAYIFENGKVMASNFGYALFDPLIEPSENDDESEEKIENYFPNMKDIKNINWGEGSGLIIFGGK